MSALPKVKGAVQQNLTSVKLRMFIANPKSRMNGVFHCFCYFWKITRLEGLLCIIYCIHYETCSVISWKARYPVVQTSRLGAVCFFCRAQAEMLSIPWSVLKVCRSHYGLSRFTSALVMFLHRGRGLEARSVGSWVQASAVRGKGGMDVATDTHTDHMWSFKDIAGHSWLLAACYHCQGSRSRLWGLRTVC